MKPEESPESLEHLLSETDHKPEASKHAQGLGNAALKSAAFAPIQAVKGAAISTIKLGLQKINPLEKKITRNDVSETGVESLRFGYTSAKQAKNAVKTTAQTIRTTQRTIKTTGRATKETGKTVVRVVRTTVKVTIETAKAVGTVVTHIAAAMMNPIVLIITIVILILLIMAGYVIAMMSSAAGAVSNMRNAYENALGLDDPAAAYTEGAEFYRIAMENARKTFDERVDALYYSIHDLPNSDLVYFERNSPGNPKVKLDRSVLAADEVKQQIKNAWLPSLSEKEILAITYVYLQKQENDAHETDGALYMVEYTQETFDAVVAALYVTTENVHEKQACPDRNCAVRKVDNPAWLDCDRHMGEAAKIINGEAPGDVNQARIDYENWSAARDSYPRYVDEACCPMEHTNHSIALTFYDKSSVLMRLGISDDKYAQWVELTIGAFENNEMIP